MRTLSQVPLPATSSLSWAPFYELLETPKSGHHAHGVALEPVIESLGRAARPVRRRGLAPPSGRERAGDQQRLASRDGRLTLLGCRDFECHPPTHPPYKLYRNGVSTIKAERCMDTMTPLLSRSNTATCLRRHIT